MITVMKEFSNDKKMMRDVYAQTLVELGEKDSRIVVLEADLMSSIGTKIFKNAFPERFINCGVQEANMIGVAAGLSATGKIPFAHTFGPFATRRVYDQVFISAAYAKLNVRIVGSDPGVTAAFNGGTHMPFEDMGLMRLIPDAILVEPADCAALADIMRQTADIYGVTFIRMQRKNPVKIYEDGSKFEIGRAVKLCDGEDVAIVSSGILVGEALLAAKILKEQGVSAAVVDMFTWKPLDNEMVRECAQKTGAIVTAENHNVLNGLGSAVADALCAARPVPLEKIGSQDRFGQVGAQSFLMEEYEMTAKDIVKAALRAIARKNA